MGEKGQGRADGLGGRLGGAEGRCMLWGGLEGDTVEDGGGCVSVDSETL